MIDLCRRNVVIGIASALGLVMSVLTLPSIAAPPLDARKSDVAGIQVVVTPRPFGQAASNWEFEVVLDTHTKPLNDDLVRASELIADGRSYAPVGWQGDQPGGHHRKGTLSFPRPPAMPKVMEVRINGIGGAGVRRFRWDIQ